MQGCACVDGAFVAPEEAKISIFDWGFLHSDASARGRPAASVGPVSALLERRSWTLRDDPPCVAPMRGLA